MATLHLVSHTHWDREWYLPYQVFRLKLVQLVDNLLDLMEAEPEYKHFTLDGQTIILDDYLELRPERREEICRLVQAGRLLIGPWHILPDEFLVGPEATIRNLLQGERTARQFGQKMKVGYIPDPFGHIGQMPQILQGFGIDSACLERGLSEEPCELWWQAPDGSRLFTVFLRDGYANAAALPVSYPQDFLVDVRRLRDSLSPHTKSGQILLMQGNDHMEPLAGTPAAIDYTKQRLDGDRLVHSTLPAYMDAVRSQLADQVLPVVAGELRSSRRFHLLPGVLSTRMWIKQRNHACETLLEKWAEPFSTWANWTKDGGRTTEENLRSSTVLRPSSILRHAWRLLMECHPHDSICGCSIDQVHEEMRPRFDQVEQLGEEITRQSLETLAAATETIPPGQMAEEGIPLSAVVVFNPSTGPRTGRVCVPIPASGEEVQVVVLDEAGNDMPCRLGDLETREVAHLVLSREQFQAMLGGVQGGKIASMPIQDVHFRREGPQITIEIELAEAGETEAEILAQALPQVQAALADDTLTIFVVHAGIHTAHLEFLARDVPEYGYRTFWIRPGPTREKRLDPLPRENWIENEFFIVEVSPLDGTFTLTDKRSGVVFPGLNRFIDGGDCGDEYNYCPPREDLLVEPGEGQDILIQRDVIEQVIEVRVNLSVPLGLAQDRQARSAETGRMQITTRGSLSPGVPRFDLHTRVVNPAGDHRLRVYFPAPFAVDAADYDGHFQVVRRPVGVPEHDESWAETPRPEQPQRAFTAVSAGEAVSGGGIGLAIANRGLPEVEVLQNQTGTGEIALTLLRCTGWLSRGDLATRQGHAGPELPTPGAQMIGTWEFDYSVIPTTAGQDLASIHRRADAFKLPMRGITTGVHPGSLPGSGSFLQITPDGFILSAVKAAEDGTGWIVRGYNVGLEPVQVRLKPWRSFPLAERVSLSEETLERVSNRPDGSLHLEVKAHQIASIRFREELRDVHAEGT